MGLNFLMICVDICSCNSLSKYFLRICWMILCILILSIYEIRYRFKICESNNI